MENKKINVAFIEGRPSAHPAHANYAKSVNSDFYHADRLMPYFADKKQYAIKRYFSWILNALFFKNRTKYDVFLSEDPFFFLGIMKMLGLISKRQKLFSILDTHTIYFFHIGKYSKLTSLMYKKLFNLYDAILCVGDMQFELINQYTSNKEVNIIKVFNGIPMNRYYDLLSISPDLNSFNIITIGNMPNENRMFYKGIDLMLKAFSKANSELPNLKFTIIGEYDESLMDSILNNIPNIRKENLIFTGMVSDLKEHIKNGALYLHTARGEAWGISITEAMLGGVPAIVSDWTGAKEVVRQVSEDLVVPLNEDSVYKKIMWYFQLSYKEKHDLSCLSREISSKYSEEKAIAHFKNSFYGALGKK